MNRRKILIGAAALAACILSGTTAYAGMAALSRQTVPTESSKEVSARTSSSAQDTAASDETGEKTLFTDRDLEQAADLNEAEYYTLKDGQNVEITGDGVYVFTGTAADASIVVDAGSEDKVQLVLDGVEVTNESAPCIYVKSADKVFVTLTDAESTLSVTGQFTADGSTNTDAVIFSRDDLVLNGTGILNVYSTENGISTKDDLKITGGTWNIRSTTDALEANDSILMADGTVNIATYKDGLHAENDEDDTLGNIYIGGGQLNIAASDDGIHAITTLQIDGGQIHIQAAEGLEATWVQVNDGEILIEASDDGINAAHKSSAMVPTAEINGGYVTIRMGSGDTDAVDSNGDLIITGGTLDITAQSPFDYDGNCSQTGGTLIINGQQTDTIPNQMMGGRGGMNGMGGMNGRGGNRGGQGGW